MVPQARLELARLSALVSKTSVSTIPPSGHIQQASLFFINSEIFKLLNEA